MQNLMQNRRRAKTPIESANTVLIVHKNENLDSDLYTNEPDDTFLQNCQIDS